MHIPAFTPSRPGTVGMELEIQLLCQQNLDLKPCAPALLADLHADGHQQFKQEVTCSMLEINSQVHATGATLYDDMHSAGLILQHYCYQLGALPCGGGTHPFQDWRQRRISDHPRYHHFASEYGYLARQFTVFGQHVHVGCPDGDSAIWLCHALAYHVPVLLALSAASPYVQGEASGFASARSNTVHAFPNSGHLPAQLRQWQDFCDHTHLLASHGIIGSLKDLYWDIRPKPEYGTVEVRIFDTPYTMRHAVLLAVYTQALAQYYLALRPTLPGREALYSVYGYNRFQAARHGVDATFIDVQRGGRRPLRQQMLDTLQQILPHATDDFSRQLLQGLQQQLQAGDTPSPCLQPGDASLHDMLRRQAGQWLA
ncbi:YbdK family carboxylate-amine ligase [Vogesella urethralis]|uniref:YbdK family carboxylate-amine ligase n=1 Tax=Vogesella urethralis TaxID=2592656 RepID=UPI00147844A6|nr:YbdK family carboxylate-amine ligase [Vogesella urethralis]